ncbi:MAG TPA: hypothetical protein VH062_22630 [Polyangiaceae bacterium]|jgi:hypothetical protein|nr:hypothetical protein [Polyangiaceae bacterium]
MALPELRSSLGLRLERTFDGVPGLLSYLLFTTLNRRAPSLARRAERLAEWRRGRGWLVGDASTELGPVKIAHFGAPDRLSRWFLDRLGAHAPVAHLGGSAPGSVPCDVEIRSVSSLEANDLGRAGWLVLPRYVHHRQSLANAPTDFERRVASRAEARRIHFRITRDAGDLGAFQRDLYEPMLARRHGARALRTGRALLRLGQRRGGLLVAETGGRIVAGAVAAPGAYDARELDVWAIGVADDAPSSAGLFAVLGWVSWAREHRLSVVDHMLSLPLFSDGLTRQKLRWGTLLAPPLRATEFFALRARSDGAAVRRFLSQHSFAARSSAGVVRVDVADRAALEHTARALANP